jgi:two-component system, OmpR family, response regulator CpxR
MPDPVRLLLVDDDAELRGLMTEFFGSHGIAVDTAPDGAQGLARAVEDRHDLVLLDVMMPKLDGFEVLRQIRRRSKIPVIMLTARTSQADRVAGLEGGADDYLPKPFGPEELLARVRAVLRRTSAGELPVAEELAVEANGVKIVPRTRDVFYQGAPVRLTALEFDILDLLVRSAGRIVSRDEIAAALHQRDASPLDRSLDVHISHVRKKLDAGRDLILTVRGLGYLFRASDNDRI